MRIINHSIDGRRRLGFLVGNLVVDPLIAGGEPEFFSDTVAFIRSGDAARKRADTLLKAPPPEACMLLGDARLLAPMVPTTILCSGSNYRAHNAEKANAPLSGKEPEFFVKTGDCVIGPDQAIIHDPILTRKLYCETELAVVIGTPGRHIPVEQARRHIFGYTIVNDVTARDRQVRRSAEGFTWYELGRGKAFDTSAPMGPAIVTADAFGDPHLALPHAVAALRAGTAPPRPDPRSNDFTAPGSSDNGLHYATALRFAAIQRSRATSSG